MKKRIYLSFLYLLIGVGLMAQTSKISGIVYDASDKEPVVGASVLVKGTTLGAVTDIDGKFTIVNVPATAKQLRVSFIGMKTVEVPIKSDNKIILEADSKVLDEVMVVAYGTAKKSSYAGSASLVKSDAIKDLPNTSFENA
jgi:hypothetical protein